jgi:hypothetical protein
MIQETHNISHEAMERLQHYLRYPSHENAVLRESIIEQLRSEAHSTWNQISETVQFDNLDLSFLSNFQLEPKFQYSKICIPGDILPESISLKQVVCDNSFLDTLHSGEYNSLSLNKYSPSTAA